jgi:TetR/AcrR family transcriptional repressor of mexJK operon
MDTSTTEAVVAVTVREGSPVKRRAILVAARDLFTRYGVDGVSMDAIAAQAAVSKRTVYDYYGDKRRLFVEILADATESMNTAVCRALDEHLPRDGTVSTVSDLERSLTAFAIELGNSIVGSAEYAAVFGLVAQRRLQTPSTDDDVATAIAEEAIADRLSHYADAGLLDAADPRLIADHFAALTVLLAYNKQPVPALADQDEIRQIMTNGVHAFIRAYGTRSPSVL